MDQLLQKLVKSKAIMDKTESIKRGETRSINSPQNMVSEFQIPQATYNIPQEYLQESKNINIPPSYQIERENTKPVGVPSVDAIKKSKLPDEIKKLMIENPIVQPQQQQVKISDDLIERASRLMKKNDESYLPESAKKQPTQQPIQGIDYNLIQRMVNEAVENTLKKNGLISESTEKTNEQFTFKVGKHIFEGKVTKIKKLS